MSSSNCYDTFKCRVEDIDEKLVTEARDLLRKHFFVVKHDEGDDGKDNDAKDNNNTDDDGCDNDSQSKFKSVKKACIDTSLYDEQEFEEIMDENNKYTIWRYLRYTNNNLNDFVDLVKRNCLFRKEYEMASLNASCFPKQFWHSSPLFKVYTNEDNNSDVYLFAGRFFRRMNNALKIKFKLFILFIVNEWNIRARMSFRQFDIVFDASDNSFRNIDLEFIGWSIKTRDLYPMRCRSINCVGVPTLIKPLINLAVSWLPERFRHITKFGSYEELVKPLVVKQSHQASATINDRWAAVLPKCMGGDQDDELFRLAPSLNGNVKWIHEHQDFKDDPKMVKYFEESLGFHIDSQQKLKFKQRQDEKDITDVKS